MANKSLKDLTARTATADSDLLHINSGGTDYKETKIDFLQGDFYHTFANDTLITTQADSLATGRYFGTIASYGHQSETGVPVNSSFYVHLINYGGNYKIIYLTRQATGDVYFKIKVSGTWQSDWTQEPTRAEITSLNNSLTNSYTASQKISLTPAVGQNYATYGNCYYFKTGNTVHLHIGVQGLTPNTKQILFSLPSGYRPEPSGVCAVGVAGTTYLGVSNLNVGSNGSVNVSSSDQYAMIDASYTAFG